MEDSEVDLRVVFTLLKNGTLLDKIQTVPAELLKPYFPCLVSTAISSQQTCNSSFGNLHDRLLEFAECNNYASLLAVDVISFERALKKNKGLEKSKKQKFEFNVLTPLDKLKTVAEFLDETISDLDGYATTYVTEYFNRKKSLDELVCAIVACAKLIPSRFDSPLIIRQLLSLNNSPKIICLTACNLPDSVGATVNALLSIQFTDDDSTAAKNRNSALLKIFSVDPSLVSKCLDRLLSSSNDLSLALTIMCVCLDNSELVSRLLHALHSKSPITTFIQKSSSKPSVKLLHDRISDAIISLSASGASKSCEETRMSQLLAALRHLAGIRLSADESRSWLLFLTRTDSEDDQYICVALSALVAYPQLIPPHLADEKEIEASLIAFFDYLKQHASGEARPMQQFFLLLSIHLHAAQCEQISALISSELKFKVIVSIRSLAALRNLFLRHGMSERDIAELASRIHVTRNLNNTFQGYLPVHCVTQLLSTRSFSKHLIPIKEWVSSQILECLTPLHPAIVDLVSAYAVSCFSSSESEVSNDPLSEQFILDVFSGDIMDDAKVVSRILTFFFVLSYKKIFDTTSKTNLLYFYSTQVEAAIPIRYLLNVIEARPLDFEAVRSSLLQLCGQYYPYMLPIPDTLIPSFRKEFTLACNQIDTFHLSIDDVNKALKAAKDGLFLAIRAFEQLESKSLRIQIKYRECVINAMRTCLNHFASLHFVTLVTTIWKKLENVIPRTLFQDTFNAWSNLSLKHEKLAEQPLLLFRCSDAVFENEQLFSCFLHLLSFYPLAGRSLLTQKIRASLSNLANKEEAKMEREELSRSLIGAEDSAIVQILLEICDRFKNPAVHDLACAHIHQMFITEPILSKVVHFQGYPTRLIRIAVQKIPSMHICLKWVPELLAVAELPKRLFAIVLIAELAEQYKIENSYLRVELVVDVLCALERVLLCDEILHLIYGTVNALGSMMRLFPQVTADIAHFLSRVSTVAASRMAVSATVLKSPSCLERRLITAINKILAEKPVLNR